MKNIRRRLAGWGVALGLGLGLGLGAVTAQAFDVIVGPGASSHGDWSGNTWTPSGAGATVAASEVAAKLVTGPVTIVATDSGKLTVKAGFAWSANTLTLRAGGDLLIQARLNGSASAGLALEYGQNAVASGNAATYLVSSPVNLAATGSYSTRLGSDGTVINYTLITTLGAAGSTTATDLQGMDGDRAGNYALGADIDASATSGWNGGSGFLPVGTGGVGNRFTGRFDGLGHRIRQLTVNWGGSDWIGLFGAAGSLSELRNLTLSDVSITGNNFVGGLVGYGDSSIVNCHVSGSVTGAGIGVGGLLGIRNGQNNWVTDSHAEVTVNGGANTGGLVGNVLSGHFARNYASGSVTGGNLTGGLIGRSASSIMNDNYASGAVSGSANVGGLVGYLDSNTTTINRGFASGAVTGGSAVGGLLGGAFLSNSVNDSYWNTDTTGQTTSALGGTGLTTAQLGSALPAGLNNGVWGNAGNRSFPYLLSNPEAVPLIANPGGARYRVIGDLDQLQAMNDDPAGSYILGADIDASATATWNGGAGFLPVGNQTANFTGTFDGLGHTISGLFINRPGTDDVGLFGFFSSATLRNLSLLDSTISGRTGSGSLGGTGSATISRVYARGGTVNGNTGNAAGGLIGGFTTGSLQDSYAAVTVQGAGANGGLIGQALGGTVTNVYATGAVSSSGSGGPAHAGGLIGYLSNSTVSNSYATGPVSGNSPKGGLVGGKTSGTVSASYWDTGSSGQLSSAGGAGVVGKTTAELKQSATFTGWNLDDAGGTGKVWRIYEGNSHPLLRSGLTALTVTANDASKTADGNTYSGGNGVSYSVTPNANLLGTVSYSGNSQGALAAGSYSITPAGLYSNQQGYDLDYVSGTLTIHAAPPPPSTPAPEPPTLIIAGPGASVTLSATTPVTAYPGSTLIVPVGVDLTGIAITLAAPTDGMADAGITFRIGGLVITLSAYRPGTVLGFRKVRINGVDQQVLLVVSGSLQLAAAAGQPLLTLNGTATLTAGDDGCRIAFAAGADGSGSIAVTAGSIALSANAFAGISGGKVQAGETARFDTAGKITGVRLGSLAGDQPGDPLPLADKPANLTLRLAIPRLAGPVARLPDGVEAAIAAAFGGHAEQHGSGSVNVRGGTAYHLLPLGEIAIDDSQADGLTLGSDGLARLVRNGVVLTLAPAPADLYRFAADVGALRPEATLILGEGGVWRATFDGSEMVLRPAAWSEPGSVPAGFANGSDGSLGYAGEDGRWQRLHPAFASYGELQRLIAATLAGATSHVHADGSVRIDTASGATTDSVTLVPVAQPVSDWQRSVPHILNGERWWQEDGRLFFLLGGTVQEALVR